MDERLARLEKEVRWWRVLAIVIASIAILGGAGQSSQEVRLVSPDGKRTAVLNSDGLVFLEGEKIVHVGLIAYHPSGAAGLLVSDPVTNKERLAMLVTGESAAFIVKDADGRPSGSLEHGNEDGVVKVQVGRGANRVSIGATKDAALLIVEDGAKSATLLSNQILYKDETKTPRK